MSEGEHKFTQLRGLAEEEPLQEKLQKTNRKFIQLKRLADANLRICGRWHGVSPYNCPTVVYICILSDRKVHILFLLDSVR